MIIIKKEKTYNEIITIVKKIFSIEDLKDYLILAGGIVPYLVFKEESNRTHGDIDFICKARNIDKIRKIFDKYGYYKKGLDSLESIGKDYGFEMFIDDIKVGVYPFEEENGCINQYSYDSKHIDCKLKTINLSYDKYVCTNNDFKFMRLEVILKSKVFAMRTKDINDIDIILRHDFNHELYSRINIERE